MITFQGNAHKSILKKINEIEPIGSYEVLHCPKADAKVLKKVAAETKTFYMDKNALLKVKGSVKASINNRIALFLDTGLYDSKLAYLMDMFNACSISDNIDMVLIKGHEAKPYKMLPTYKQDISEDIQDTIYEDEFEKEQPIKTEPRSLNMEERKEDVKEVISEIETKDVTKVIKEIQKEANDKPSVVSHHAGSNNELVENLAAQIKSVTKEDIEQLQETYEQIKPAKFTKLKRAIRVTAKEMVQIANDDGDKSITYIVIFDKSLDKEIFNIQSKGYEMYYIPAR